MVRDESKNDSFQLNYYMLIIKERNKEIRLHTKNASFLYVQIIIISIALAVGAFVHGPLSLLLSLPVIVFYFLFLIWSEQVMMAIAGKYLREEIEPKLNVEAKGWETYLNEIRVNGTKLMAIPYLIFPPLILSSILVYLQTLPIKSIFYLKGHLILIGVIYGTAMEIIGLILYLLSLSPLMRRSQSWKS